MSVMMVSGIVAVAATAYLGRKGWLAFHRAVGITPGKLEYVEPSQLSLPHTPTLIQLDLKQHYLEHLPPSLINQLQRIDTKADLYQQYIVEAEQAGHTVSVSEQRFVLSKLLDTRLPEVLESYHRVTQHEARLSQSMAKDESGKLKNKAFFDPVYSDLSGNKEQKMPPAQSQAFDLLTELLSDIEQRLDTALQHCQDESLQELQAMRRYINERKRNEYQQ